MASIIPNPIEFFSPLDLLQQLKILLSTDPRSTQIVLDHKDRDIFAACKQSEATKRSSEKSPKTKLFHLAVQGRDRPQYWMHLEAPTEAT